MAIAHRSSLHSLAATKALAKDATSDARLSTYSQHDQIDSDQGSVAHNSWPVHPIPCMRGAFQESIIEAMDPDARIRQTLDAATRRLQLLELDEPKDEHYTTRWRRKPGAKFHPLWKLIAQISFGIHLLHQRIAKSEEEVIRILQTHVDEIDGFLEDAGADFDLAMRDIDERLRLLLLPLEHGRTFNKMLRDRDFRNSIIEGNDIIERICTRTNKAMSKSLDDVEKGLEATAELAKFLDRLEWNDEDEEMQNVYTAMKGNTEGWNGAFRDIRKKGEKLKRMIRRLERIVTEVERQAGMASRRKVRSKQMTSEAASDKATTVATPSVETAYETLADVSRVASPTDSRRGSSYRASLNKPLPPDPHRRSSKQGPEQKRRASNLMTSTEQSSSDFHSALEQPTAGTEKATEITTGGDRSSMKSSHSAKPSQDSFLAVERAPESIMMMQMVSEKGLVSPSQIPLPLSPHSSRKGSQEEASPQIQIDSTPDLEHSATAQATLSPEELLQQAIPKAHVPELHTPAGPRPGSHVADKHKSASVVDAYHQSKTASRSSSQHTSSEPATPPSTEDIHANPIDAGPPRISLHFAYADQLEPSPISPIFRGIPSNDENAVDDPATKGIFIKTEPVPPVPPIPTIQQVSQAPQVPPRPQIRRKQIGSPPRKRTDEQGESSELADAAKVRAKIEEAKEGAFSQEEKGSRQEIPVRVTVEPEGKEVARALTGGVDCGNNMSETTKRPTEPVSVEEEEERPNDDAISSDVKNRDNESTILAAPEKKGGTHESDETPVASEPKLDKEGLVGPKAIAEAWQDAQNRASMLSMSRTRHSMSSIGTTVAQESIAVHGPRSRTSDPPPLPKRSLSVHAIGPAINGLGTRDLPEIVVEPQSPQADSGRSVTPPSPSSPPIIPERSPARASPRSGGRSPVSYKLMPNVQMRQPSEQEAPPKTALPQWPKPEQSRRFKKPNMNVFRGVLFKKNSSKQMSTGGLGGNVAMA